MPRAVLRRHALFYRCGVCEQIFWPSSKSGRAGCHAEGGAAGPADGDDPIGPADPAVASTAKGRWRPSSQIVMALGAEAKSGGQMLREARGLHADLRPKLELPCATFYY